MSGQHTPGRLGVRHTRLFAVGTVMDCVATMQVSNQPNWPDDARRLAACWNACEGLDTEGLENLLAIGENIASMNDRATTGHLKAISEANRLRSQRDELLAALREIADGDQVEMHLISKETPLTLSGQWGTIARAAIAKAEGGAA